METDTTAGSTQIGGTAKWYKLMKMVLLALLTACLPPWNAASNRFPGAQALGGRQSGRAQASAFALRRACQQNEGEAEGLTATELFTAWTERCRCPV